jgi:hypothetical protein
MVRFSCIQAYRNASCLCCTAGEKFIADDLSLRSPVALCKTLFARGIFCEHGLPGARSPGDSGPSLFLVWLGTGTFMSLLEFLIGELEIWF